MSQNGKKVSERESRNSWGIGVQNITPALGKRLGLNPGEKGVVISEVHPGSPAASAGLRPGDIILEINRKIVGNVKDYYNALRKSKSGEGLLLLIKRGNANIYSVLKKEAG